MEAKKILKCEVCEDELGADEVRYCCEKCARAFGPCCNTNYDNLCVECVE